jgi:hypothetical protein
MRMFIRGRGDPLGNIKENGRAETGARINADDIDDVDHAAVGPIPMTTVMAANLMTKRSVVIANANDVIESQMTQANRQEETPVDRNRQAETSVDHPADRHTDHQDPKRTTRRTTKRTARGTPRWTRRFGP